MIRANHIFLKATLDKNQSPGPATFLTSEYPRLAIVENQHTFLNLVTEQVDLLSSRHTASRSVHPHYLQVGGVGGLWRDRHRHVVSGTVCVLADHNTDVTGKPLLFESTS